jgi:hypothetical protein
MSVHQNYPNAMRCQDVVKTSDVPGQDGQSNKMTITFKVEGKKVTGTLLGQRGEAPISKGRIEGDMLTFNIDHNSLWREDFRR